VLSPDYNRYMDTQQAINLDVLERFQQEGIEFAYPTQTLHLPGLARADA
jgi:small-conductance mechanosensitive channel